MVQTWFATRKTVVGLIALVGAAFAVTGGMPTNAVAPSEIEIRGRIVCLPEIAQQQYQVDLDPKHEHVYALATRDRAYPLLHTRYAAALFVDPRFREKELLLRGRVLPPGSVLEVLSVRSVRNGVVHDLYYYCAVCEIKTLATGPCMCCRGEMELVERAVANGE